MLNKKKLDFMIEQSIKNVLKESPDTQKLSKFVKSLGIDMNKVPKDDNKPYEFVNKNIDPVTLGLFAPAITEMTITVTGGWTASGKGVLNIKYQYKHPDGSNGYSLQIYTRDGKTFTTNYYI